MTRFPVFHAIMRGGTPPPFEHSPANSLIALTVRRQLPAARALLITLVSIKNSPERAAQAALSKLLTRYQILSLNQWSN